MAMSEDQPQRAGGVLPPPPSSPDDGPTALTVPPLQPPPQELAKAARASGRLPLRSWLLSVVLFLAGTALTYYLGQ